MGAMLPVLLSWNAGMRFTLTAFCLLVVACVPGCDYLPFGFTQIGEIVAKAPHFEGREVKVRGKVTDVNKIPLLNIKSYALQDDSGAIVVITPGSLPAVGENVALRGVAESMLILGGQSFGLTLKEIARLPTL